MNTAEIFPKWLQELERFLALKSEFFLYGNVYDCYYFPVNYKEAMDKKSLKYAKFNNVRELLEQFFIAEGFDVLCYFDVIDGIAVRSSDGQVNTENIISELNLENEAADYLRDAQAKKLDDAISFLRVLSSNTTRLSVGIVNYASRITSNPNSLEEEAKSVFLKVIKAAQETKVFPDKNGLRNILVFICDKLNDIPVWVLLENPLTKGIEIQKPEREERLRFFEQRYDLFYCQGEEVNIEEVSRIFPDLTENFSNRELENLITISNQEELHINKIKEVVELFKYGVRENPWETIDISRLENAENELKKRVIGQDEAIRKSVEILRRANLGLDSIDKKKPSNKPKGVLFFAGPTGTGKTELAKSVAELLFSDEDAIIRFDMSEYNDSNSDVKLIGSPPGYVGYEEGGQLTDSIQKKPFSIILFDEIEKAHPKIFDKFLQILDDGRLTDGKGETVYFSQSLIIFTSNLGIYTEDEFGNRNLNVHFGEEFSLVENKVKEEIKNFFGSKLGRPEIFNRFGDNFVVFDFIRSEVGKKIVQKNLVTITQNLAKMKNISLEYDEQFISSFMKSCAEDNLEMGGRGIVNRIETHIKNGLTNYMFDTKRIENGSIRMEVKEGKIIFS